MFEFTQEKSSHDQAVSAAGNAQGDADASPEIHPMLHLQRLAGNQAVGRLLHERSGARRGAPNSAMSAADRVGRGVGGPAVAGGAASMPIRPLSDTDRAFDLQSTRFSDDKRLQAAFDDNPAIGLFEADHAAVTKIQQALLDLGYSLPTSAPGGKPNGIYDQETVTVVKAFQWRQGIVKDGVVGRQTLGEMDGLFTGREPPGTRASGPEVAGDAVTVSEVERSPKKFGSCGGFTWSVDWKTNARNGYLVQEIIKEHVMEACSGDPPVAAFTPHYWEAWRVQEDGGVHGTSGADDDWINPSADASNPLAGFPKTKGHWKITGKVFFVKQLDLKAGFKAINEKVPDAGTLWSTANQPSNLGSVLLTRTASDSWDCCGGASSTTSDEATGTAKPGMESE